MTKMESVLYLYALPFSIGTIWLLGMGCDAFINRRNKRYFVLSRYVIPAVVVFFLVLATLPPSEVDRSRNAKIRKMNWVTPTNTLRDGSNISMPDKIKP